jgi:acyl-coenzyme A thioesterase PaaI-like protein
MDGGEQTGPLSVVKDGEWAGWGCWVGDPFEDHAGPFYFRIEPDGQTVCAMRAAPHQMNTSGYMHGGAIMTFADFSLFMFARDALAEERGVTATLNGEFIGAVQLGALVECRGEVVKAGRSMIFLRGLIATGGEPVMTFSGVIKKLGPRKR